MSYRITIAGSDAAVNQEITACLGALGHQVIDVIQDGTKMLEALQAATPDLLLIDSAITGNETVFITKEIERVCQLPIILLLDPDGQQKLLTVQGSLGASCLLRPLSQESIRVAIDLTVAHYREAQELNREVQDLKQALARRKTVERAKGILMDRFQLSEGDAYRRLQQLSQRENRPMMEVAQAVIMLQSLWDEEGGPPPTL
ncbi:MAG TPA: ANTAR domain-containing protein [Armatimonadota bacterium]